MYVHIHIINTCMQIYMYVCMSINTHITDIDRDEFCMYTCMHVYVYMLYECIHLGEYIGRYESVRVCMSVCIYPYPYVYRQT